MASEPSLIAVDETTFDRYPCCGIKDPSNRGRCAKQCWLKANAKFGLRARTLLTPEGQPCGYIEYIPGEYAWRAVDARGYMFIHCVWNHSRRYQGRGWGTRMIDACIDEARREHMHGVAVLVREGPWLAGPRLFVANGFQAVDSAAPDWQLLVRTFNKGRPAPRILDAGTRYGDGLTVVRTAQCPYTVKFSSEIAAAAETEYGIHVRVVDLQSPAEARSAPTPYAAFTLLYQGRVIADHQISCTRFRNIMNRLK